MTQDEILSLQSQLAHAQARLGLHQQMTSAMMDSLDELDTRLDRMIHNFKVTSVLLFLTGLYLGFCLTKAFS